MELNIVTTSTSDAAPLRTAPKGKRARFNQPARSGRQGKSESRAQEAREVRDGGGGERRDERPSALAIKRDGRIGASAEGPKGVEEVRSRERKGGKGARPPSTHGKRDLVGSGDGKASKDSTASKVKGPRKSPKLSNGVLDFTAPTSRKRKLADRAQKQKLQQQVEEGKKWWGDDDDSSDSSGDDRGAMPGGASTGGDGGLGRDFEVANLDEVDDRARSMAILERVLEGRSGVAKEGDGKAQSQSVSHHRRVEEQEKIKEESSSASESEGAPVAPEMRESEAQDEQEQPRYNDDREGAQGQSASGAFTRKNVQKTSSREQHRLHNERIYRLSAPGARREPKPSTTSDHVFGSDTGTFEGLGLLPELSKYLVSHMGLARPMLCQTAAVPVLLQGKNTVIKSETGSGKTLAFLLPIVNDLAKRSRRISRQDGTYAVIIAPTRELGVQIYEVLEQLVRPFVWLVPGMVFGGEKRKSEKARLRKGVTILVATPGRLLDHLKATKSFLRNKTAWLVLDEADRLLDLGFEKQIKEIVSLFGLSHGSHSAQVVMVSATITASVAKLAGKLLGEYTSIDADRLSCTDINRGGSSLKKTKAPDDQFAAPHQLVQHFLVVTQKLRLAALAAFLKAHARKKVIVFMSTCDSVDFHYNLYQQTKWPEHGILQSVDPEEDREDLALMAAAGLEEFGGNFSAGRLGKKKGKKRVDQGQRKGKNHDKAGGDNDTPQSMFGADCQLFRLHGNVPQAERLASYRAYSTCTSGVLFCTDVAARGLDLPTVDWIVQYDPPSEISDYVHRVGRTARKGLSGHSLLFIMPLELEFMKLLKKHGLQPAPLSLEAMLLEVAQPRHRNARDPGEVVAHEVQQCLQVSVESSKDELLKQARAAFQSHIRAYATHSAETKQAFNLRSLHFGHVARSFGLKDPPTTIKMATSKKKQVRRKQPHVAVGVPVAAKRRAGGGGSGGAVRRLGLSKLQHAASRAEFL
ncbi:unnamed protein product [Chrysoparadoxa australica]